MKLRKNLIRVALIMLIMIIAAITTVVAIIIIAFKIHILIGIIVLCAIIYWICRKLLYIM